MSQATKSQGTTIFVLGLLGLILCQVLAPIAWIMGNGYIQQCALEGVEPEGLGVAGRVMGMIGTALVVLNIAVVLLVVGGYCLCVGGGFFAAIAFGG